MTVGHGVFDHFGAEPALLLFGTEIEDDEPVETDPDTSITSEDEQSEIDASDDGSDGEVECKTEDCPPDHIAVKSTDADGNETCSCQSTQALGEGVKAVGKGLGMIALAGLATTGIVVYGLYRIIRG
tara:strand:- start:431 stop:811 length:381 start_codon:yes stop_codon:yes gene_type:complete